MTRIRELMVKQGLTLSALAGELGFGKSALCSVTGRRRAASKRMIRALVTFFDYPAVELFDLDDFAL